MPPDPSPIRTWVGYLSPVRTIDGDTFIAFLDLGRGIWDRGIDGKGVSVRIRNLYAPELREPGGHEAANALADILNAPLHHELVVPGSAQFRFESFRVYKDNFGRTLADVYTPQGRLISELMIAAGHGTPAQV